MRPATVRETGGGRRHGHRARCATCGTGIIRGWRMYEAGTLRGGVGDRELARRVGRSTGGPRLEQRKRLALLLYIQFPSATPGQCNPLPYPASQASLPYPMCPASATLSSLSHTPDFSACNRPDPSVITPKTPILRTLFSSAMAPPTAT